MPPMARPGRSGGPKALHTRSLPAKELRAGPVSGHVRRMELIVLIGLPAAGKSSFFRERFSATHALISKDLMPRALRDKSARQLSELARLLGSGASVAVDNTNPRLVDREPLIAVGRRFGARVVGYFFPPDVAGSLRRNQGREGTARVPKVAVFLAQRQMQPPSMTEGFDALYEVRLAPGPGFEVRSLTS